MAVGIMLLAKVFVFCWGPNAVSRNYTDQRTLGTDCGLCFLMNVLIWMFLNV
jgi:hypothetical protein